MVYPRVLAFLEVAKDGSAAGAEYFCQVVDCEAFSGLEGC
jgi:hypothetical protein